MANRRIRYLCPLCGKKAVYHHCGSEDSDYFECSRAGCDFECYQSDKATQFDRQRMTELRQKNPGESI